MVYLSRKYSAGEIYNLFLHGYPHVDYDGELDRTVRTVSSLEESGIGCITFCDGSKRSRFLLKERHPTIVFLYPLVKQRILPNKDQVFFYTEKPKIAMHYFLKHAIGYDIRPPTIQNQCSPNCIVYPNVIIGNNCTIGPNSSLGHSGLGLVKTKEGYYEHFCDIGNTIIGDRVRIGSNCTIARGVIGDTVLEDDVQLGHGVNIGHNAHIGRGTILMSHATIGRCEIGEEVRIGMNASIKPAIAIGDKAVIGMGAVVVKDIPKGMTVVGNPAKELL